MLCGKVVVRRRVDDLLVVDDLADERGKSCADADFHDANQALDISVALVQVRRARFELDAVLRAKHGDCRFVEVCGEVVAVELLERRLRADTYERAKVVDERSERACRQVTNEVENNVRRFDADGHEDVLVAAPLGHDGGIHAVDEEL